MEESRSKRLERFGQMHSQVRVKCGKSQEYMAMELGVNKKTIQNWEKGISSPSYFQSLEWFRILNVNPFPYLLSYLYPDTLRGLKGSDSNEKIEEAFNNLISSISINDKRALLYLYYGDHGSSPHSVLQLLLAHLHLPMILRINDACNVDTNYKMAKELNMLVCPDNIQPDLSDFKHSIIMALEACKDNRDSYTNLDIEKEDAN